MICKTRTRLNNNRFFLCVSKKIFAWVSANQNTSSSASPHVREFGFRNPGEFCMWNNAAQWIRNPKTIGMQNPSTDWLRVCLHEGGVSQVGEVTWGGLLHLTCKRDHIKMRDYMDRRVTPPKRVTSPIWGPPPSCKQALKLESSIWNPDFTDWPGFHYLNDQ